MRKSLLALAFGLTAALSINAQAETFRVGTHPTFAPFEFTDKQGKIIGFDLDIIKAIAKANGDEIQIESMPFDGLIPSLITNNIDAIISGMTITAERQKRVSFTDGYYGSNLSLLMHKDKANEYKSVQDFAGKPICVQIGTTGHEFAKKISPDNIKALNNEPDAILELTNGGCEAVINDRPVNLYYLQKSKLDTIVDFVDPQFTQNVDNFGIAVRKDNTELLNKLNAGLEKIRQSGELDKIHLKWFGVDSKGNAPASAQPATLEEPANTTAE